MKIIQFVPSFLPFIGGLQLYADGFAQALVKEGNDVLIVTFQAGQNRLGISHRFGYNVYVLPSVDLVYNFPFPAFWKKDFWKGLAYIRDFHAKRYISHTRFFVSAFLCGILAKKNGVIWTHIEHGTDFVQHGSVLVQTCAKLYDWTFGRWVFNYADDIIGVSEWVKGFVSDFSDRSISVQYRGFEWFGKITPNTLGDIGFIGRITRSKGVFELVEGFGKYIQESWDNRKKLLIAWEGPDTELLVQKVQELGISEQVIFLGKITPESVYERFYSKISILVNPSYTEWLPTTVIEALLAKCVVIASDVGGTREISSKPDCSLIQPKSVSDIITCLYTLFENDSFRSLQGSSFEDVKRKFSWDSLIQSVESAKKDSVVVFNLNGRGGMLHYSSQFCNELVKTHKVTVVLPSYTDRFLYDEDIEVLRIDADPDMKSFLLDTLKIWQHIWLLFRIYRSHPKVIHIMDNHPWYLLYTLLFRAFGYDIYVTQHDPFPHSGEHASIPAKVAIFVNSALRFFAHKLIVHGEVLQKQVIERYGINPNKVLSVPHGAYTFFTKWKTGRLVELNTFLFFGRIVEYKWLDILLEALDGVKKWFQKPFKLIIAGGGDMTLYASLTDKHRDVLEIMNRDILEREVAGYFERSEFVVLPYKDATASWVIPVAYAFGKPVIATRVGTIPDYVEDGKTGFLVEPNNPEKLAEKIVEMLEKKDIVQEMGVAAKRYNEEKFWWADIVKKIYG